MSDSNLAHLLGDIRIPEEIVDQMLGAAIESSEGRTAIEERLKKDREFHLRAIKMTHDILISTTLAQTLKADQPFGDLLVDECFSGDDVDLHWVGVAIMGKIKSAPRLASEDLAPEVVESRLKQVEAAL